VIDVLIEAPIGQRGAPNSEDRRCVGNTLSLMFQYEREAQKRD
jgi:hypothetical protein